MDENSKRMVLLANGSTKYNCSNTFEKMDPLPSLVSLPSDIEESIYFTTFLIFPHGTAKSYTSLGHHQLK